LQKERGRVVKLQRAGPRGMASGAQGAREPGETGS